MLDTIHRMMLSGGIAPPPKVGPIPPPTIWPHCYTCPSPNAYDQTPWWTDADLASRDFLRASHWSRVVPGLPFVPGGSSEFPERLVQGLDYRYDRKQWWPKMVDAVLQAGDTHWLRWWPDCRVNGANSEEQFVDDCLYLKSMGIRYVKVWLTAKGYDKQDASANERIASVQSLVEKCQKAGAVDEYTAGGEYNLFNVPGEPTISFFRWVGERAHEVGASAWAHFGSEVTSWFADGDSRGRYGFWDDLGDTTNGIDYQGMLTYFAQQPTDPQHWDIGELQARIVDTLRQFREQGNRHRIRGMEWSALESFTREHPTPEEHDSLGWCVMCTRDQTNSATPAHVWGSGDGIPFTA
jgi:hypothetical protein